jgi:hypothetical protein
MTADLCILLSAFFATVAACALLAAHRCARSEERAQADYHRRLEAAVHTIDQTVAANRQLQHAVAAREQTIAGLLNRLNARAIAAARQQQTAGQQTPVRLSLVLGLPVHHIRPDHFSRN